ncbi:MAG: MFS transporter [Candidatus Hodarchaeales archaeon]|jgi:MFS family permease
MKNALFSFLGIKEVSKEGKSFIIKAFFLYNGYNFLFWLVCTFLILHVLDYVSFLELGFLIAFSFFIQAITDYPTGVLSDWLGQRFIMCISAFLLGLSYIFFALFTEFFGFFLAYGLLALAEGQRSGTFRTWFDNNYKLFITENFNRHLYIIYQSKLRIILQLTTVISFIIGGILISSIGRSWALLIQGFLLCLYSGLFYFLMTDHPSLKRNQQYSLKIYKSIFVKGLSSTWKNSNLRWVIFGVVLSSGGMAIWSRLLLFPLYESYGKSDDWVGIIRACIYSIGIFSFLLVARSLKNNKNTWNILALTSFLSDIFLYLGILLMLVWNPIPSFFSPIAIFGLLFTFGLIQIPRVYFDMILPRYYLESIPDSQRNSVYSLIPTLILIVSTITVSIAGIMLEYFGLEIMLLILAGNAIIAGLIKAKGILSFSKNLTMLVQIEKRDLTKESLQQSSPTKVG